MKCFNHKDIKDDKTNLRMMRGLQFFFDGWPGTGDVIGLMMWLGSTVLVLSRLNIFWPRGAICGGAPTAAAGYGTGCDPMGERGGKAEGGDIECACDGGDRTLEDGSTMTARETLMMMEER